MGPFRIKAQHPGQSCADRAGVLAAMHGRMYGWHTGAVQMAHAGICAEANVQVLACDVTFDSKIAIMSSSLSKGTPEIRFCSPNKTMPCTDENKARVISST